MASTIQLNIVSQDARIFSGVVDHVNVTAEQGELGVYPNHAPLLARLRPGVVSFQKDGNLESVYISGGFIEVQPTVVSILADVAIRAQELDQERILKAKEACENKLGHAGDDLGLVAAKLKREIAKLRAYELLNAVQKKN